MGMEEKKNQKGQTYDEFLAEYEGAGWPNPSITVDNVLFSIVDERPVVLLVKRGNFPDIGEWAFPGGFVGPDETCEEAAARELEEEAGITGVDLEQLYTVSTPGRDPRCRCVTNCFMGVVPEPLATRAGDDAAETAWFFIDYAAIGEDYELILKSGDIVLTAVMKIRRTASGKVDINASEIVSKDGIAFDHAKLILYAIETL
jgi:ADP-ribose pyrophosphatase YjhB (NUDIX family)